VIDLGVMVPCEKILETARAEKVDVVGLSGLITPSLDEMVHVAREMERIGLTIPLLIGGATTSRQHTAVRVAPEYSPPTVHVLDASRAVSTVSALLDPNQRPGLDQRNRADQQALRELHSGRKVKPVISFGEAEANRARLAFDPPLLAKPSFLGRRILDDVPLQQLVEYIDWTFFFTAWELRGRFPQILEHPEQGEAARELYKNATRLLGHIVDGKLLCARGSYGFWPANSDGNDIVLFSDATRAEEVARFNMLRQQQTKTDSGAHLSLADFVAPLESGVIDHVGAFAVTAGIGCDALARRYEQDLDDYSAIICKALADRLAEAFAEMLHQRARKEWYAPGEALSSAELIDERFRGIRPAFGYPACPDHSEKRKLFNLLDAGTVGMSLTESCAMLPAASVSGIYLAHPEARYFNVGKIGRDQVVAYARRKGVSVAEVERWLGPNLGYEPAAESDAA
jgi:5-methyltetrahydrofolate--homocysteine methyltransferase